MQQTQLLKFYAAAFGLNALFFSALYVLMPSLRSSLIEEGTLLENLTAILAFNSFWIGLFLLRKYRHHHRSHLKRYALLPTLGLLLFLDEISFGQDIFGFEFMTIGGMEIDSLHDFVSLFYKKAIVPVEGRGSLWYGIASIAAITGLIGLTLFVRRYRHRLHKANLRQDLISLNQTYPPLIFVAIAIGLGLLSTMVDLRILQFKGAKFLEEMFEMNAALALLLACFAIRILPTPNRSASSQPSTAQPSAAQPSAAQPSTAQPSARSLSQLTSRKR